MSDSTCTVDVCASPGPRGGPCKDCFNKRQLAKYYANREERLAANKRWRDAHAEQVRANRNRWFAENADRRAEYLDLMRDERNELARQRRAANPGSGTEYSREWRRKNHDRFALRNREAARRRQTGSAHSRVTYRAVLERDGMVCHICGGSISDLSDLHFDHVIPLSKGGAHSLENIRPAHALCNMRKSDKII